MVWNACCELGEVASGQYAKVESWDSDWPSADDEGGHVYVQLTPGGFSGGTLELESRGAYTEEGSSLDLTVLADWS